MKPRSDNMSYSDRFHLFSGSMNLFFQFSIAMWLCNEAILMYKVLPEECPTFDSLLSTRVFLIDKQIFY